MEGIAQSAFAQVAIILMLAAAVGLVGSALRQPLIVSFIVVGIAIGWLGVGLQEATEAVQLFSDLGVVALLFLVGLRLDVGLIRSLGRVVVVAGLGQIVFTSSVSFAVCHALGLSPLTNLHVSFALTLSSTIIVVKLLSDRQELETLHGRIALGILIVQDIVVIAAMAVMATTGVGSGGGTADLSAAEIIGGSFVFMAAIAIFMRWGVEPLLSRLAARPELLVSFAIGWAAVLAAVADILGLGKELGGLIAGVSFASTTYRESIASRLSSLRDFLLVFFFVGLGAGLDFANVGAQLIPAVVLSLLVLIVHPWIVIAIMGALGYRRHTSFMTALSISQISEFSLIFIAMGHQLGHVDEAAVALVTIVGLITITFSTHLITYAHKLYPIFEKLLAPFERKNPPHRALHNERTHKTYDVVVLGFGRFGKALAQRLAQNDISVLGVDFDPHALGESQGNGPDLQFGDIFDPDLADQLPLDGAKWVVCSVPFHPLGVTHHDPRLSLIETLKRHTFAGRIAVIAYTHGEEQKLRYAGADLILKPFSDAATHAAQFILDDAR